MTAPVLAATAWNTNADMILDCVRLGYLRKEWLTLDPTWGRGNWWTKWKPTDLIAHDIATTGVDFRSTGFSDNVFDAVAFDPPYKLNGTPTEEVDGRYGVGKKASVAERHQLIVDGIDELWRVLKPGAPLLLKCQDQVCSGRVHWQTHLFTRHAESLGMVLVDALYMLGGRPQPAGRRQVHARRNLSTLLVLQKGKS